MGIKLSEFRFDLPSSLIALHPTEPRDHSRLMVVHRDSQKIEHKTFKDVINYFSEGDLLVTNDTKVFSARLYGHKEKTGAKIEVFLLRELNKKTKLWDVMVDPARKIRVGNKLFFGEGELIAEVIDNTTSRGRTIRFLFDGSDDQFYNMIETLGETPIPPEINRPVKDEDSEWFQTIYAKHAGSVVAPTAGLHFTPQLLKKLELVGVNLKPITLHVGLGTFRTVGVEDITKHKMESENYSIELPTAEEVNKALQNRSKICAVGTTVMKVLERSVTASGLIKENSGWTDIFIYPPYEFKICNTLITNFHLPGTVPLMAVAAFGGYDLIMEAYQTAIKEKYHFYCYGDAMIIV